jgi:hypothetical protein
MTSPYQFNFADPSVYSDWAKYVGLNRTTGEMNPSVQTPQGSEPPPETLQDYAKQAISPVTNAYNTFTNKLSNVGNAGTQLMQGNVAQAYNAIQHPQQINPAQQQNSSDYSYHTTIGY